MVATKLNMRVQARFRSYDALRAQLDENLTMLRRDSVDTLQVHESDHHTWWTDSPPEERHAPLNPPTTTSPAHPSYRCFETPRPKACAGSRA